MEIMLPNKMCVQVNLLLKIIKKQRIDINASLPFDRATKYEDAVKAHSTAVPLIIKLMSGTWPAMSLACSPFLLCDCLLG